ncbi:PREDICTED: tetraspanin-10 isoform X1 [Hipposideros armiger]|uniref:Tetraspanin-10 isoform X1 n=1 Tax=Hipposideros armiger TaxID=186990 RepID=A0A8B7SZF2_HIPAR|nr:PREDICTED: tetraspanin-10 isoform X1 [Hipposideros armiger]
MEEGEKSPLLSQDAGGQEPPLSRSSPLTSSHLGPAPWEKWAQRTGFGGGQAPTLPWGSSCLKCLTFLSNFLFSLLGLLALAIGLWGLAVKGSLGSSWGGPLPADPMLGLVLGGLAVSVVSLAGCLGALCENACLLRCFSGGLLAFLVLEAVVGALVVALWGPLQDGLEHALRMAITHYQDDPDLQFLIDQVQLGLQCCGAASYQDWQQNLLAGSHQLSIMYPARLLHHLANYIPFSQEAITPACMYRGHPRCQDQLWKAGYCVYFNCSSAGIQACSLPASCCINPREDGASINDQCGFGALGLDEDAAQSVVHLEGCGAPLRRWLRRNVRAVGGFAIAVVVVQGAELLLATRLVKALAVRKGAAESPGLGGAAGPVHPSHGPCDRPPAKLAPG